MSTQVDTDETTPREGNTGRRHLSVFGLDFVGLVVALFFFAWSLSPSLIPREWYFQGLISGVTGIVGYGIGVLVAFPARRWIAPRLTWWRRRHTVRRIARWWSLSSRWERFWGVCSLRRDGRTRSAPHGHRGHDGLRVSAHRW